mmetsp:Transcript_54114/g.168046  ORF Transcript_54114/g.168046 Transcript_54114/m.168046 type:complete len:273 (-) Transcript_54114:104-922(-)
MEREALHTLQVLVLKDGDKRGGGCPAAARRRRKACRRQVAASAAAAGAPSQPAVAAREVLPVLRVLPSREQEAARGGCSPRAGRRRRAGRTQVAAPAAALCAAGAPSQLAVTVREGLRILRVLPSRDGEVARGGGLPTAGRRRRAGRTQDGAITERRPPSNASSPCFCRPRQQAPALAPQRRAPWTLAAQCSRSWSCNPCTATRSRWPCSKQQLLLRSASGSPPSTGLSSGTLTTATSQKALAWDVEGRWGDRRIFQCPCRMPWLTISSRAQ